MKEIDVKEIDFNNFRNKKNAPTYLKILGWVFYALILFVLISQTVFSITYFQAVVYGESMQNTLNSKGGNKNDVVWVNRFKKGEEGDIIIATDPNGTQIIKRIIAKENDRIRYEYNAEERSCVLYVNGEKKVESYIKRQINENVNLLEKILPGGVNCVLENVVLNNNGTQTDNDDFYEYVVPEGHVFVMGDNRENSKDSREYGAIKVENIEGVVEYILHYGESGIAFWFKRTFGF